MNVVDDHQLRQLRQEISDNDRAIVNAIGKRVKLVRQLWQLKRDLGLELEDPSRERWIHQFLRRCNFGGLSNEAVDHLVDFLLDLTKREIGG